MPATAEPILTVRPTAKFILMAYMAVGALLVGGMAAAIILEWPLQVLYGMVIVDSVLCLWCVFRHMKLRYTCLTVAADQLRYEEGFLSKSTRSLHLQKIQDVRVEQSLFERIFGIGTLTLETAGETGRMSMPNVDHPQRVADKILSLARQR